MQSEDVVSVVSSGSTSAVKDGHREAERGTARYSTPHHIHIPDWPHKADVIQ